MLHNVTHLERKKALEVVLQYIKAVLSARRAQRELTSQTDLYLVILSSKTYVFEDKMTKYKSL